MSERHNIYDLLYVSVVDLLLGVFYGHARAICDVLR